MYMFVLRFPEYMYNLASYVKGIRNYEITKHPKIKVWIPKCIPYVYAKNNKLFSSTYIFLEVMRIPEHSRISKIPNVRKFWLNSGIDIRFPNRLYLLNII